MKVYGILCSLLDGLKFLMSIECIHEEYFSRPMFCHIIEVFLFYKLVGILFHLSISRRYLFWEREGGRELSFLYR